MKNFKLYSEIALRNISRHWRRSLAAILSLASGFAAINLFEGYIRDVENIFDQTYSKRLMYGHVLVQPNNAVEGGLGDNIHLIDPDQQRQLKEILASTNEVTTTVQFLNVSGLISNGSTHTVFRGIGYDLSSGQKMREPFWTWNTLGGEPLEQSSHALQNIVIGKGLGHILDCSPTALPQKMSFIEGYSRESRGLRCPAQDVEISVATESGQMNTSRAHIVGVVDAVYREFDVRYIAMALEQAQALVGTGGISLVSIQLKEPAKAARFIRTLETEFESRNLPLKVFRWQEHSFGELYIQSIDFLHFFRDFTLFVTLVIISLSVFSQLTRLIQERTREIGTLRCLGFRTTQIRSMFLVEALYLSIFGSAFGAVLTLILAPLMNALGIVYRVGILSEKVPFRIELVPAHFAMSALTLITIAALAASIAIERSVRKNIPECLAA
jgi:putative ABC transport system permease protein